MGGDGTVNEVLNGMADTGEALANARLAVLPAGTVNVFARELGLPFNLERAWATVTGGREKRIDVPQMQVHTRDGMRLCWFAQMAGCGIDARAVELMDWETKKRIGRFAYLLSGLRALREPLPTISVSTEKRVESGKLVLIGNGRLYGGPLPVFRRADLSDGLLDVCVFPKVNWFVVLRYACAYVWARVLWQGHETHFQASSLRLESAARTPVEVDGELIGELPAACTIRKQALRVLVP
jgi:YegS/Rv2252/BmrU family lipid kinase